MVLERFDGYWGDPGVTREIVYRPIPEAAARVLALESGDVDVISRIPATDIPRLESRSDVAVHKLPGVGAQQFRFNVARKPYDDPRVRRAVSLAIDRQAIVRNLVSSFARPSTSALTPIMRGYTNLGEIAYDPAKARQLLAEAGHPNGFATRIATTPRYPMGVELAEAVAADLKKVGIQASIDVFDWATMVQFWAGLPPEKNPQEIFIMGAGASTADADWGLRPIFRTATTNENNYGYYSNAEFDRVIDAAMRETDPVRRQALYTRAQQIVYLEDPGAVWLFDTLFSVASRRAVTGLRPLPLGVVTFERAAVERTLVPGTDARARKAHRPGGGPRRARAAGDLAAGLLDRPRDPRRSGGDRRRAGSVAGDRRAHPPRPRPRSTAASAVRQLRLPDVVRRSRRVDPHRRAGGRGDPRPAAPHGDPRRRRGGPGARPRAGDRRGRGAVAAPDHRSAAHRGEPAVGVDAVVLAGADADPDLLGGARLAAGDWRRQPGPLRAALRRAGPAVGRRRGPHDPGLGA